MRRLSQLGSHVGLGGGAATGGGGSPPASAALKFNAAANSQYVPIVAF